MPQFKILLTRVPTNFKIQQTTQYDNNGNIYVTDMNNHRIQKFTSDGQFVSKWGSEGTGNSQFLHPHGLDVDAKGERICK